MRKNTFPTPQRMTEKLRQVNWEKISTVVPQFQYKHQKITTSPQEMTGPGWEAVIDGTQEVSLTPLLMTD